MKRPFALLIPLALCACAQAPDIADWPPKAPDVSEQTIQRYVDTYAAKEPVAPVYGPDDIDALNLLTRRMLRNDEPDSDIERLRRELDDIRAASKHEPAEANERSRNEINAIKRRIERRYESKHDQRMELKRYGL